MHIIGRNVLNEFAQKHPNARSAFGRWCRLKEEGNFGSIVELREKFPHADLVLGSPSLFAEGNNRTKLTVFNIGGNKACLTAFMDYKKQRVIIRKVETHAEYSKRNLRG